MSTAPHTFDAELAPLLAALREQMHEAERLTDSPGYSRSAYQTHADAFGTVIDWIEDEWLGDEARRAAWQAEQDARWPRIAALVANGADTAGNVEVTDLPCCGDAACNGVVVLAPRGSRITRNITTPLVEAKPLVAGDRVRFVGPAGPTPVGALGTVVGPSLLWPRRVIVTPDSDPTPYHVQLREIERVA